MVTRDVLAIECGGFVVSLDNLDLREDYPKPKLVETTVEVHQGRRICHVDWLPAKGKTKREDEALL